MVIFFRREGQYKIQQMAFMILAIFFFFILVGLFFVGWLFANMQGDFRKLQEEKAISALKVIADSTELNCDSSETLCIDRDKLIAFSESSYLYEDYWSIASIELLIVYPPRGSRKVSTDVLDISTEKSKNNDCEIDHDGDGIKDRLLDSPSKDFSLMSNMGRLDHQSSSNLGNARPPLLVFSNLVPGERIGVSAISGQIFYSSSGESFANCDKKAGTGGYGGVVGGFYTSDGRKILERALVDFSDVNGVVVPNNAHNLYFYVVESNEYRFNYMDNEGSCSFSIKKLDYEACEEPEADEVLGEVFDSENTPLVTSSDSETEPILCPGKDCDYYILYDSGQVDKQTFSAYVTVCERVDRSHEICELAKLMLGVQIKSEDG